MAFTIFQANTKAKAAQVNANFDFLSRNRLIALDTSGAAAKSEFDLGDLTVIANGSLVGDLLARSGKEIQVYNTSGALQGSVSYDDLLNLQSATTLTQEGTSFLPKQITIANGTDTDHDIDFGAGNFIFDDGSGQVTVNALTKRLDASFVVGDNQGMLDAGTIAANTIYHLYEIHNPTTVVSDFLASTSISSPTLPSGFTKKNRFKSMITDGSSNIINDIFASKDQFLSTEQTITLSGQLVLAHNLSLIPSSVIIMIRCIVAEHGYSVGDFLILNPALNDTGDTTRNRGFSIVPDSTNITIRNGTLALVIIGKDDGAASVITPTSWKIIIKASL